MEIRGRKRAQNDRRSIVFVCFFYRSIRRFRFLCTVVEGPDPDDDLAITGDDLLPIMKMTLLGVCLSRISLEAAETTVIMK